MTSALGGTAGRVLGCASGDLSGDIITISGEGDIQQYIYLQAQVGQQKSSGL